MNYSGAALLLRFDGHLRLMWWLTPTLAQTPVAQGHTPSPRTLVAQADTSSQNASLLKVGATLLWADVH